MFDVSPTFAKYQRLARQGNVVPVYRTVVADLLSPVSAFLKLAPLAESRSRARPYHFLLESVEGGERIGRYTFFGVDPFQVVTCRAGRIMVNRGARQEEEEKAASSITCGRQARAIGRWWCRAYHLSSPEP